MKIPNGSSRVEVIFAPTLQRESKGSWKEHGTTIKSPVIGKME